MGLRGGENGSCLMGRVSILQDERAVGTDGGSGCTTM